MSICSDVIIIRGCGCSQDEACNLCGFEACQLAWQEITALKEREKKFVEVVKSAIPTLFGIEPELHKRALVILEELGFEND